MSQECSEAEFPKCPLLQEEKKKPVDNLRLFSTSPIVPVEYVYGTKHSKLELKGHAYGTKR